MDPLRGAGIEKPPVMEFAADISQHVWKANYQYVGPSAHEQTIVDA